MCGRVFCCFWAPIASAISPAIPILIWVVTCQCQTRLFHCVVRAHTYVPIRLSHIQLYADVDWSLVLGLGSSVYSSAAESERAAMNSVHPIVSRMYRLLYSAPVSVFSLHFSLCAL